MSDSIGNETTQKNSYAVPEKPRRLTMPSVFELNESVMDIPNWLFLSLVEHPCDESETRGDGSFTNTQEESSHHQTGETGTRSMAHQDATPEKPDHLAMLHVGKGRPTPR